MVGLLCGDDDTEAELSSVGKDEAELVISICFKFITDDECQVALVLGPGAGCIKNLSKKEATEDCASLVA